MISIYDTCYESKPIEWGNWTYKVGDKVLFNESRRFGNVLYNNLKGSILSIDKKTDEIVFQILVDKIISERDVLFSDIKLIDCDCEGKSIVEFSVKRRVERDSDSDYSEQIVPFQIAYAVSIHKAQGLEYKSVKVVITEDIDEKISHNIFYTAITTGKTVLYEMLEDLRLTNEYKAIKLFNYKSDNFSESIEQCRDSFIVVDNADNLINDEVRRFINFEPSNQYMLFLRNCDGLNVSDKSFKVLKFDNNRITLEEEL